VGGGGQAKIAMSRQGRGLLGWMDGRAGKVILPQSGLTALPILTLKATFAF